MHGRSVASGLDPFRPGDAMPKRSVRSPVPCGKDIQDSLDGLARGASLGNRVDGFLDDLGQVADIGLEVRLPRAAAQENPGDATGLGASQMHEDVLLLARSTVVST